MSFSPLDSTLLGPLFTTAAMRAVFSERNFVAAMLRAEVALARAQAPFGLVPPDLADAIAAISPDDLDIAAMGEATGLAGVPVIPFVKAVQSLLPAALEPFFHKGATTQDIFDTALALQMQQAFALVADDIAQITAALATLAKTHRATPCVGRTYGQHAAPVTFGYKVAGWRAGIADAGAQLPALQARALVASLGGPVGILTAMGAKAQAVKSAYAENLGLGSPAITRHTLRGSMAEAGCWLAILIGALAKMAVDVANLASTEVSEVAEPWQPGRGGSSAMPHKRNPVSATLILAAHSAARGHVGTLIDAMAALHERPPGLWHAEWHALPQLFGHAAGALREAGILAKGLVVDEARMLANIDATRGLLFADAVANRLAPSMGGNAAHHLVEKAAGLVRETGKGLRDVLAGEGVDAALIAAAFDLSKAVDAGAAATDAALGS